MIAAGAPPFVPGGWDPTIRFLVEFFTDSPTLFANCAKEGEAPGRDPPGNMSRAWRSLGFAFGISAAGSRFAHARKTPQLALTD